MISSTITRSSRIGIIRSSSSSSSSSSSCLSTIALARANVKLNGSTTMASSTSTSTSTSTSLSSLKCYYRLMSNNNNNNNKPKLPQVRSKPKSETKPQDNTLKISNATKNSAINLTKTTKPTKPTASEEEFMDPQILSDKRIAANVGNLSGIEAVEALPAAIHMRNYATAAGLVGFVVYVWWYSMTSVGKASGINTGSGTNDDPLANLQAEAQDARQSKLNQEAAAIKEADDLAMLDIGVSEKDLQRDGVTIAVAAPDHIATAQETQNQQALNNAAGGGTPSASGGRPLWRRIVFFWQS